MIKMFFSDDIEHPKWTEWCNKTEEESTKIAEQNEWLWYFDWFDVGDILRYHYEKADKSPNVTKKYNGYDRWDEKHQTKSSYVYLGADASFHTSNKPTHQWTEYNPCTNINCKYNQGEYAKTDKCGYFGCNERIYDCFNELFASIQAFIDVCGIEELDKLAKDFNIHKDIIGWFKYGDNYFKRGNNMSKPFWVALSELKIGIDGISVFWTDGTMYVNGKDDTQASTSGLSLFQAYKFALLINSPCFDYEATDEEVKQLQKELLKSNKDIFDEDDQYKYIIDVWGYLDDIADDYKKLTGVSINDINYKRAIVSYMSETYDEDCGMGFGSATYIAKLLNDHILGNKRNKVKRCNSPLAIQLAEKYLPTDDYDLHKFAEKLHEDIKITHEIDINGSLWVNSAKYEYVDKIVVGYDDVDIYWKGKMIGSIARENLQTMLEQNYEENTTIDLIEELVHSFDMTKVGDL